ncbi:UNVERIFIED_CONTAM: Protein AF-10 [Gekko kuhli]
MVSSEPLLLPVSLEGEFSNSMKEMIGGCCVCSDERGWTENPLVYCDGHGCNVAVHQDYSFPRMSFGWMLPA